MTKKQLIAAGEGLLAENILCATFLNRMKGVQPGLPGALVAASVLAFDLEHVLRRADEMADKLGVPRIVPGLGRHYDKET